MNKFLFTILNIALLLLILSPGINGATRYSVASGSWNNTAVWSATSGGTPGASVPVAGDVVYIENGHTITVTANAACTSIEFNGLTGNLVVNSGFTLNVSANVTRRTMATSALTDISGAGTINCAGLLVGTNTVSGSNNTSFTNTLNSSLSAWNVSGNVSISSYDQGQRIRNSILNFTSGIINVGGSVTTFNETIKTSCTFTLADATLVLTGATPFSLTINGTNVITLNGASALVNYARAGDQPVYATTYTNLSLSGSGVKTLGATTVNGILTMDGSATTTGTAPVFGASSTLQYIGGSVQTTGIEFPATFSSSGGVIINKTAATTVTMNGDHIITSTLSLQSGILSAGTGTLTFQNSNNPVSRTSGSITAPANSTIAFGSAGNTTGTAFSIPDGTFTTGSVHNLSVNRDNSLTLNNDLILNGTLSMLSGEIILGPDNLTFQTSDTPISRITGTITTTSSSGISFGSPGNTGGNSFSIPAGTFTNNPAALNTLSIYRTNQLTLGNQMLEITGSVLCSGPLVTNGNITLLSTAAGTAYIDGSGTGAISGNVTMQRYLATGGYKYFSSPFSDATVNQFFEEVHLSKPFPRFYSYDEADLSSSGWVDYTDVSGSLEQMYGYAVNFGPLDTSLTVNITGSVTNGPVSRTLNNSAGTFTQGFNLVGNPYPSPIDWNSASGWTKTNIEAALYFFKAEPDGVYNDQYSGNYYYYISDAVKTGDADNIIPSMQAFFVHVADGTTGTLAMNNSVRSAHANPVFIKGDAGIRPLLELTAAYTENPGQEDPLIIYFDEKGTENFDGQLDAYKLMNTSPARPNFYSMAGDGKTLAINSLPVSGDSLRTIPLGIRTEHAGKIFFRLKRQTGMPEGTRILLHDAVTSTDRLIDSVKGYSVTLPAGDYNDRFSINFYFKEKTIPDNWPGQDFLNAYHASGKLITDIGIITAGKGRISLSSLTGQSVFIKEISSIGYHEFDVSLKTGIYILSYQTGKLRVSKKIFISDNQ